ncbi:hypothetical protein RIF29_00714 [Crotalaria pallida]|uniref:Trichome birefringence-like N-terminal domain-containing protein n=1 Tax=Crotalaria pallida TaxID=3830 RepID=A0AAN9P7C9_CROPI
MTHGGCSPYLLPPSLSLLLPSPSPSRPLPWPFRTSPSPAATRIRSLFTFLILGAYFRQLGWATTSSSGISNSPTTSLCSGPKGFTSASGKILGVTLATQLPIFQFHFDVQNLSKKAQQTKIKFDFDPEECNVANGKWVFNHSIKPLYSDSSCPYIDRQYSCVKNGREDSDYLHWEWQPEDCTLPRFNPKLALKKLQGKRLLFVGDSLQRNQWESFVCLVQGIIPAKQKSMKRGRVYSVFKAKHLIFNQKEVHCRWGSFANGEEGFEELDTPVAYKLGLRTWANWVDSTVNPKKTRVFFTTMSADWGNKDGVKCFNETKPVRKKNHWGSGSNKGMMSVVAKVVKKMKVPVTIINITQISEYRIDGHSSVYTETGGKMLTKVERANPQNADCIHWCLPGVPDTWNLIFLAMLLQTNEQRR